MEMPCFSQSFNFLAQLHHRTCLKERANVIFSVSFHPHFFCTLVVPLHRESFAEQTERLQACFEIQFDLQLKFALKSIEFC
jgi:hypothetical protein